MIIRDAQRGGPAGFRKKSLTLILLLVNGVPAPHKWTDSSRGPIGKGIEQYSRTVSSNIRDKSGRP
jgi:hypothetical protein